MKPRWLAAILFLVAACGSPTDPEDGIARYHGTIRGKEAIVLYWPGSVCGDVPVDWLALIESEVIRGVAKAVSDSGVDPEKAAAVSFDGFTFTAGLATGSVCSVEWPGKKLIQTACNCGREWWRWIGWEARNWVCDATGECIAF